MDRLTPEQRSFNMSRIRSKNTKPELFIFTELEKLGIAFEKHYSLPGKPDIAFVREKIAIFIDGEFWHGKYFAKIEYRLTDYWIHKISHNRKRDRKNRKLLRSEGWTVIRIWDDDLKKNLGKELNKILRVIDFKIVQKKEIF